MLFLRGFGGGSLADTKFMTNQEERWESMYFDLNGGFSRVVIYC